MVLILFDSNMAELIQERNETIQKQNGQIVMKHFYQVTHIEFDFDGEDLSEEVKDCITYEAKRDSLGFTN